MTRRPRLYQPLPGPRAWLFTRSRIWCATDHLLLINDQLLQETYVRVYWTDVEAILLYSLSRPAGFLLALEWFCLIAVLVSAPLVNLLSGTIFALVFAASYAIWRLTRAYFACQITTRLSTHRFPLRPTLTSSRKIINHLKSRVESAQASFVENSLDGTLVLPQHKPPSRRRSPLIIPAIVFALGLFAPLSGIVLAVYILALLTLFLFQRRFDFPFSVRSAAVLSDILVVLQLVWWIDLLRGHSLAVAPAAHLRPDWVFHILRTIFSLFGIAAIYERSLGQSRNGSNRPTVLGLS